MLFCSLSVSAVYVPASSISNSEYLSSSEVSFIVASSFLISSVLSERRSLEPSILLTGSLFTSTLRLIILSSLYISTVTLSLGVILLSFTKSDGSSSAVPSFSKVM